MFGASAVDDADFTLWTQYPFLRRRLSPVSFQETEAHLWKEILFNLLLERHRCESEC